MTTTLYKETFSLYTKTNKMLKLKSSFQQIISINQRFFSSKVFSNSFDACKDIKSGDTVLVGGFGLSGIPENSIKALNQMAIKNLNIVSNNIALPDFGVGMLLNSKQIKKIYASYVGESPELFKQYQNGDLELELIPQGTLAEKLRAGGAGIPAFYTASGVSTIQETGGFVTKYKKGGKEAELFSKKKPRATFKGRDFILEESLTGDFALIKAMKGDRLGNLVFDNSTWNFNGDMASAGKITIAEVFFTFGF